MNEPEFQFKSLSAATVTIKSLEDTIKKLEWLKYEVDPEWSGFCQFGPDDIGGVWEKLGVIRRKPEIAMFAFQRDMIEAIERQMERDVLTVRNSPCYSFLGIPVVESMAGNFIINAPPPTTLEPIFPVSPMSPFKVRIR